MKIAVATKLHRSMLQKALICITEHTLKHTENEALLRYVTLKCERAFRVTVGVRVEVSGNTFSVKRIFEQVL